MSVVKNFSKDDLLGESGQLRQAQDKHCSGLVVGIMARGFRGCIQDSGNRLISINDIILDMDIPAVQGKPKVLIPQCCQALPKPEEQYSDSVPNTSSAAAPITVDPPLL